MWSLADLHGARARNPAAARALYDRIPVDYPNSGLRDDARWFAAQLSRALGDPKGAVERLRALLATREVAIGPAATSRSGSTTRSSSSARSCATISHDLAGAAAAFRRLPKDYPASILRDDALYELAVTLGEAHDAPGACRALADLAKLEPDSKYRARADDMR